MKYIIIFISLFVSICARSQDLDGTWVSIARMDVLNNSVIATQPDSLNKYTDGLSDSVYFEHFGFLIEFLEGKSVLYGNIGGNLKTGDYIINKDTIEFKFDTLKIKVIKYQDQLTILDLDKSKWQNSHLILKLLNPPLIDDQSVLEDFGENQFWQLNSDSLSTSFGMDLFLIDSSHAMIHRHYDNWNSRTTSGLFQLKQHKGDLFFHVFDEQLIEEHFFRVFTKQEDIYYSQSFEQIWYEEEPRIHEIYFSKKNIPTAKQLKSISKKLIGNWYSAGSSFPFDSELSDYDSIVNTYYYCTFSKSKFKITYGGELIKDGQKFPENVKYEGTWKMGPTGKYLELHSENNYKKYLTIVTLNENNAIISLGSQTLGEEWMEINLSIELKKGANN